MKVLVTTKRVVDYTIQVRPNREGTDIDQANIKMSLNPFDEIALEEAIRLKEQGVIQEVIAVSIGPIACQDTLRHALAMGADSAILIVTDHVFEPFNIAKILQFIVLQQQPDMVLMGKQAIDDDCNQTGQLLAGLLNWSQATFISKMTIAENRVHVTREVDAGLEKIVVTLPCVITVDLRLNEPRYISLPSIMKAKQKTLQKITFNELDLSLTSHVTLLKMQAPAKREPGIKLNSIRELMDVLRNKEKVL